MEKGKKGEAIMDSGQNKPYTIQKGDTFGQIVLNNKQLMSELKVKNPNASIWGNDGLIAKAAERAGFTDKNGDGSIIDEAGKIYAGKTINFNNSDKTASAPAEIKSEQPKEKGFLHNIMNKIINLFPAPAETKSEQPKKEGFWDKLNDFDSTNFA